ncbi:ionotropic receptor 25a-like [Photinus pyralis]|uniref:ionotropic receptor 25a-like n=1 Tax=Photinus pyralis TaxID=7054 RepID=UPI00126740EF|nr:ionotropic receptor 25a-like [Photinus pyralis]
MMDFKYKTLLLNIGARHVVTQINTANILRQLMQIKQLDIMTYFILGSLNTVKLVLNEANDSFFTPRFSWYILTQDSEDVKCNCRNATIVQVRPVRDESHRKRLEFLINSYQLHGSPQILTTFYFDLALRSFLAMRNLVTTNQMPKDMKYIPCKEYDVDKNPTPPRGQIPLKKALSEVSGEEPAYGPFNISTKGKNSKSYMQFDMEVLGVTIKDGVTQPPVKLGKWKASVDPSSPIEYTDSQKLQKYRPEVVYRVYTVVQPPFVYINQSTPRGYSGLCIDFMDMVAKQSKFDYEIRVQEKDGFGQIGENGKWNGIMKQLIDKKADIALGTMGIMAERETFVDFTVPYYDMVGFTILMKLTIPPSSLFKFLTVLEHEVWICILSAFFLTSLLLWAFDRWSPYSLQNNPEKYIDDEEKREFHIKESLWFCMTSLTPQGGGEAPKNLSGRLVAATWWLFGFIIIASYTANLAAFLTVSRLEAPIESLDDLTRQYKIQYSPLLGSETATYFERMSNVEKIFYDIWKNMSLNDSLTHVERAQLAVWDYPVSDRYTKIWQTMIEAGMNKTLADAVKRVRTTNSTSKHAGYAFIGDATDIKYLELTTCDLQKVGDEFSRKPYALAVQQGSHLKDILNTAILDLLNKGEMRRLSQKWWKDNPYAVECDKEEDQTEGISVKNIGGVFIVIFVGICFAFSTLIFEYWYYKHRKVGNVVDITTGNPEVFDTGGEGNNKGATKLPEKNLPDVGEKGLKTLSVFPREQF